LPLEYVQIHVYAIKPRSHCRSDQLNHPDHPNSRPSSTKLDRSSFTRLVPDRVCSCM